MVLLRKNTDDLRQEIQESPNLEQFLTENKEEFRSDTAASQLSALCRKKQISKAALAKRSCMSEVYLHQIFSGRRTPSRNRLICLCFGLQTTLEEAQTLLRICGQAQLYPKDKRDAIIQHALLHGTSLVELNQTLFTYNLEMLF